MKSMVTRKRSYYLTVAAVGLWLAGAAPSHASTVLNSDPVGGGLAYTWTVNMSGNDTTAGSSPAIAGNIGSLSWADPGSLTNGAGWTHTSNWAALTLTEAANLSITLAANSSTLVPAFTLWSGHHQSGDPDHSYNQTGAIAWAPGLTYIGHEANLGGLSSITKAFSLDAGQYSIVFGGNPPAGTPGVSVAYQATLATVPVPAAVWLFGSGLAGLVGLARRRATR